MNKRNLTWTIRMLQERLDQIEFPEFQREPTVWDLDRKRKLIDSILRGYDIASIYLYRRDDRKYECIDGRQRINAMISFMGLNETSDEEAQNRIHNGFKFTSSELLSLNPLSEYSNRTWDEFKPKQQEVFLSYEFNIIEVSDIEDAEDLNLMFLRLQLGAPLNAGEKLNAMGGDMKDLLYQRLWKKDYFQFIGIPNRRYAKQLTAAQIALNYFAFAIEDKYKRARFVDLQEFIQVNRAFDTKRKELTKELGEELDSVYASLKDSKLEVKNRAVGVTLFLCLWRLNREQRKNEIPQFIAFMKRFLVILRTEVKKGINIEHEFRDLLTFQTYVTQAAVEPYAIRNRETFLFDYFEHFKKHGKVKGEH